MKIDLMRFLYLIQTEQFNLLTIRMEIMCSVCFKLFGLGERNLKMIDKQLYDLKLYESILRFLIDDKT